LVTELVLEQGGVDGTRTRAEKTHETAEKRPDRTSDAAIESSRLETARDQSRPVETAPRAESTPTDAELERAIVDAVTMGAVNVARLLAARLDLEERRRASNVVDLERERAKRQ
jgi:hypothetical protein